MALGRDLDAFNIEEFTGGCNYSPDISSLAVNESPNAMNMVFDGEVIRKRFGYTRLNTTPTGASDVGYSVFDIGVQGEGRKLVAHFGSKVYKTDNLDGVMDQILASAPLSASFMAEVNQKLVLTFTDNSTEYYWNGTDATMSALSASSPGFRHVIEHQGYLLGGNVAGARLRIYYEDINTMVDGSYADFFTLKGGKDDEVTGWLNINGRVYATTKEAIFKVSYIGGVSVFSDKQVVSTTGMVPRTGKVVITEEFGEVAIFLGYDLNLYMFDGSFARAISGKFRFSNNDTEIALDRIDQNYFTNFHATYDSVARVYRLFATRKGQTTNQYCLNVDVRNFAYYPFDNMTFASSTIAQDRIGRRFLIGADYTGQLHKLFIDIAHDNGVVIKEYYESPPIFNRLDAVKKAQFIGLLFTPIANYSLRYEDRSDFDKTWKCRDSLLMAKIKDRFIGVNTVLGKTSYLGSEVENVYHAMGLPITNNMYRFKLHTNATKDAVIQYTTGTVSGSGGGTSITGAGTTWTSDMTSANGWKIHIVDGDHANEVYDFTYVSGTTATVSTMVAGDFAGATYELYRTGYAGAGRGWELLQIDYDAEILTLGKGESRSG